MAVDKTWPITRDSLRSALGYGPTQGDDDKLDLYAEAACERIDEKTGRVSDPTRHLRADGTLPTMFILAARETAKLWVQQAENGPRGQPSDPGAQVTGPPLGIDLPRRVEGWLSPFPPAPGIA